MLWWHAKRLSLLLRLVVGTPQHVVPIERSREPTRWRVEHVQHAAAAAAADMNCSLQMKNSKCRKTCKRCVDLTAVQLLTSQAQKCKHNSSKRLVDWLFHQHPASSLQPRHIMTCCQCLSLPFVFVSLSGTLTRAAPCTMLSPSIVYLSPLWHASTAKQSSSHCRLTSTFSVDPCQVSLILLPLFC